MEPMRRSSGSGGETRRSILKKESFIDVRDDLERALAHETPEQYFQRILDVQNLSPLDLCDRFCYGDARKHRHVPLKHVCEVLFELDEPGRDPMTDAMEEFLYGFSFDSGNGDIVVDIKEALRTLDIWKIPTPASPKKPNQLESPKASVSPAKAAILQVKADKLKQAVSSLQQENLRLSRALSSSTNSDERHEFRPPSPLHIAVKKPLQDSTVSLNGLQHPRSPSKSLQQPSSPTVVSRHERALIALANRLEYTGVKKLEERLRQDDKANAGFVSLKQLRWHLANDSGIDDVSEAELMTLCLGMNFNAQGLVDYTEFIRVLLDILVYESRPKPKRQGLNNADAALLTKLRAYLNGFSGSRDKTRALLSVLCDKYDLEGNQSLAVAEMVRVLQSDLANHHPVKLKFPLTQSETRRLLLALNEPSSRGATGQDGGEFVYYPSILDGLFRADTAVGPKGAKTPVLLARVLLPTFWTSLRSALCPHDQNPSVERKIHAQLCKILQKLDPKQRFAIAQRHFVRVFDQHWSARDLDVLATVLSEPLDNRQLGDGTLSVRYDILMRLLFGAPELRDASALARITKALWHRRADWQDDMMAMAFGRSQSNKLSYEQVYELLSGHDNELLMSVTAFLYLVAHVQDGSHRVDVAKLWALLSADTANGPTESVFRDDSRSFSVLQHCIRTLLDEYGLENALKRLARHEENVVAIDDVARELEKQFRGLELSRQEMEQVHFDEIHTFLESLGDETKSPAVGLLYTHTLMDGVFDWDGLTSALRLPDRLVDVKKTLELFDWDHNGSIDADDWAKAWRQLTVHSRSDRQVSKVPLPLHDWELCVLARRFPGGASEHESRRSRPRIGAIDYSRLLMFLLERQQRVAREQLQAAVVMLLRQLVQRVTQGKHHVTTFHLEHAFEAIDRDGKGYFHIGDLRGFVLEELKHAQDAGMDVDTLEAYARQGPALEAVMASLVGDKTSKKVVSLMRFQELLNRDFCQQSRGRSSSPRRRPRAHSDGEYHADNDDTSSAESVEPKRSVKRVHGQITLLRDLELCLFEVAKGFVDANGQISPAAVYTHLNGAMGSAKQHRRPRSQSPVRSARPPVSFQSSYSSSRRSSCSTPKTISESTEPLTASRLKHSLRTLHGVETSTHLIGQFFLRLGASTKHILERSIFAQWLAPLSMELQSRVKQVVREMLVKSKSGGGHVDLERFISAIERRLTDAQLTDDMMAGRHTRDDFVAYKVRPSILLSRLHELNVSLRKSEMNQLLRHVGLEDQHEIDFAAFLRRLYELGQQIPVRGDR